MRICLWFAAVASLTPLFAETLQYRVKWPSGVSLGTARMESSGTVPEKPGEKPGPPINASMVLDASFPGVPVLGEFRSQMNGKGCTQEFEKKLTLALRKTQEKTTVQAGKATRKTGDDGGKSTMTVGPCPLDALAFLQMFRRELKAGRVVKEQNMLFGAQYAVKAANAGAEQVALAGKPQQADRYTFHIKGPASDSDFEILFARDEARTPVEVRVTMGLGKFRLELVP
ncbi:MAG: DUF3108 domain-containing protein [Acidobacteriota bacterium]